MTRHPIVSAAVVIALMVLGGIPGVQAAEVSLIASNAVKEPLQHLIPAFEKETGNRVRILWGGTEAVTKRISGGEVGDAALIAAPNIDRLIQEGKLATGSRADIAKSLVGIAIRPGLPKPDVSSAEAVKQAVLAAHSIAYSSGPSGFYLQELFRKMGIAEQIKGKVKQPASGVQIAELLARGEADLGFQQVSELLHAPGIEFLGPLPMEIQNVTVWSVGLHSAAPMPDAAKALVQFLTSAQAASILKSSGLEPAS